jgi:hypothetical protein
MTANVFMNPMGLAKLHDATLVGIEYASAKVINLTFRTAMGMRHVLKLDGVVNFYCTGMLEGNIVESVEVLSPENIEQSDRDYFVSKEGRGQTSVQLENAIRKEGLSMLLLSPSYGAEVGAVCKAVNLA